MYDCIYVKCAEQVYPYRQNTDWWLLVLKGECGMTPYKDEVSIQGDEKVLALDSSDGCI